MYINGNAIMYEFIKSFVRKDRHWSELDISSETVSSVYNNYQNVILTIREVADNATENISLPGNFNHFINASQYTTDVSGFASRAIDGNLDGVYSNGSVTHSNGAPNQWWEGVLESNQGIKEIIIHNRTDGGSPSRLNNFHIIISDTKIAVGNNALTLENALLSANDYHYREEAVSNPIYRWVLPESIDGQYIMIFKESGNDASTSFSNILSLAEVTVILDNEETAIQEHVNIGGVKHGTFSSFFTATNDKEIQFYLHALPLHGNVTVDVNGDYQYIPNPGFAGLDIFSVSVIGEGVGFVRNIEMTVDADIFSISLNENQKYHINFNGTITEWLDNLPESEFATTETKITLEQINSVKFHDVWKYPVTVEAANIAYGEGQLIPEGSRYDIRITNDLASNVKGSVTNMEANMLLCVDGRIVNTEIRDNWWYGINGNRHLTLTQSNLISLIDFNDVGGITRVPLDETNVTVLTQTPYDLSRNQTRVVIDFSSTELHTVSPLMVLDGFLHVFDGTYSQASSNHLLLTIDHKRAVQRIVSRARDASASISFANVRDGGVNTTSFDVLEYLKETDSFAVLVNTRDLNIMKETLGRTGIFGQYTHYRAIQGLVFYEDKELVPYTIVDWNEHDVAVSVKDNRDFGYLSDTNDWENLEAINGVYEPERKIRLREAHCIDLYTFV